jgi:hypothetical protein
MGPTATCSMTNTKLARIAWLSARDPGQRFDHWMHHFTEESLAACFHALDGNKAVGLEGVSKAHYGEHLRENLVSALHRASPTPAGQGLSCCVLTTPPVSRERFCPEPIALIGHDGF